MNKESSNEEKKGLREKILAWVEQLFLEKGFVVKRQGLVNGEGISHAFDLLAEYSPLPGSTIRIGVIIVDKNDITLDFVEKMLGWLDELHSLKIILIPLNKVDGKAKILAQKYGIDIVVPSRDVLSKLGYVVNHTNRYYVKPIIDLRIIAKKILEKTKRSLFRTSKCRFEKLVLTYYPLLEFQIELSHIKSEIEEAEVVEGKIVFDGLHGYIVKIDGDTLKTFKEYGSFIEIPEETYNILRVLTEERSAELDVLSARTRLDKHTLKSLLAVLSMHGLVDIYSDLVELKPLDAKVLFDISEWIKKHNNELLEAVPKEDDKTIVLQELIPIHKIKEILESLGARIDDVKTIYFPLYTVLLKESGNDVIKEKISLINGITGSECEELGVLLTNPDFIDHVRRKKGIDIDIEHNEKNSVR